MTWPLMGNGQRFMSDPGRMSSLVCLCNGGGQGGFVEMTVGIILPDLNHSYNIPK